MKKKIERKTKKIMEGGIRVRKDCCWFYVPDFASSYFLMLHLLLLLLLLSIFDFHIYILFTLFLAKSKAKSKSILFHHDNSSTPFSFSIAYYYFLDCYGNRLEKGCLRFFVCFRKVLVFVHENNLGIKF